MAKVALIIGGTGGIGYAISELFSKQSTKVYLTYVKNYKKAQKIKKTLSISEVLHCDITIEESVKKVIERILQKESNIDIVVNCTTSKLKLKPFDSLTVEEFYDDIQVILRGSVNICKCIIPLMKKNKSGVIINLLTSAIIDTPPSRMSSYVTAKYGLLGLTKCLAVELERFNVRIVGLSPAFVETELINGFPIKLLEIEREKQSDKRLLQPVDIAKVAWGIVNGANNFPNGSNIIIKK